MKKTLMLGKAVRQRASYVVVIFENAIFVELHLKMPIKMKNCGTLLSLAFVV